MVYASKSKLLTLTITSTKDLGVLKRGGTNIEEGLR